ncbi:RNA methyltransferase [bacterium]|nr:RNA methyltransferase [bacterium]
MSFLKKNIYFTGLKFAEKLALRQKVSGFTVDKKYSEDSKIDWNELVLDEFDDLLSRSNIAKNDAKGMIFRVTMKKFGFWKSISDQLDGFNIKNVLLLDRIQDTHNFGAICRTARWAGVDLILIPQKGNAPVAEGSLIASSGYLLNMRIIAGKLNEMTSYFKDKDFEIISTVVDNGISGRECSRKINGKNLLIMMGNERWGLSKELEQFSTQKLTIPMENQVDSLNVSVATGIILHQLLIAGE